MTSEYVNVMLVEADDADAQFVESSLREPAEVAFHVDRVSSLADARLRLQQGGIDVILLELALPDSQGLQSLSSLGQLAPLIPTVILTRTGEDVGLAAVEGGAQAYLLKQEANCRLLQRTLRYAIVRNHSVQWQRRMVKNLAAAEVIQQHLLPKDVPQIPGFDLAAGCFPAEKCSGDFYDFIRMKGCLTVMIADVAGHGFGPAMLGAAVSAYLEAGAALHHDIHEMLTLANWLIAKKADGQFVTLFSARIDPRKRTLVYCAAGHQGYVISASGHVRTLSAMISPLGVNELEVSNLSLRQRFKPGDILFLMTDGIWEAMNEQHTQFGIERALRVVHHHRRLPAEQIVRKLYDAVLDFTAPCLPVDDVTMIVVKALDPAIDDDTAEETAQFTESAPNHDHPEAGLDR